jgi:hypothetical protein
LIAVIAVPCPVQSRSQHQTQHPSPEHQFKDMQLACTTKIPVPHAVQQRMMATMRHTAGQQLDSCCSAASLPHWP